MLLQIEGDQVRSFDYTTTGCVMNAPATVADLGEVERQGERLHVAYGINHYFFDNLQALPARCVGSDQVNSNSLANFDSMWQTLNEHYAFFDQRAVNWTELRERYRSQLSTDSTDVQLYTVLKALLAELADSHVQLEQPESLVQVLRQTRAAPANPSNFELTQRAQAAIISRYVGKARSVNAGMVRWGKIDPKVGYLQLNAMLMLADYGLADVEPLQEFFGRYFQIAETITYQYKDEVAGAERIVRQVLDDLKDTKALIIDLRFNGGGKDEAALTFLRPLIDEPTRVFNKKARTAEGFTPNNWVTLQPLTPSYRGRVYLLTSVRTASAAEIMVMASLSLPQVTRIGGATEGVFSDTLDKRLPNGWNYTLSNEVYTAADGRQFEGQGIEPDHRLPYSREPGVFLGTLIADLQAAADGTACEDQAIDLALKLAHAQTP